MKFTDDDLKRLKEYVNYPRGIGTGCLDPTCVFTAVDIGHLLARLEAAERCLMPSTDYCVVCHCEDCEPNKEAWRKAAGKLKMYCPACGKLIDDNKIHDCPANVASSAKS